MTFSSLLKGIKKTIIKKDLIHLAKVFLKQLKKQVNKQKCLITRNFAKPNVKTEKVASMREIVA